MPLSKYLTRAVAAVAAVAAVFAVVLANRTQKPRPSVTVGPPGSGDSLAKLARLVLTDSNPRAVAQAIVCEHGRLHDVFGAAKAELIAREVFDTVYTNADRERRRQVDRKLANNMFTLDCGRRQKHKQPASSPRDSTH
jgi:hypothetical protein